MLQTERGGKEIEIFYNQEEGQLRFEGEIALSLVKFHGFLVEFGSFLAGNKSLDLQVLSGLHESFGPLGESVALVSFLSGRVRLLGNNFSGLGLHQVSLGLSSGLDFSFGSSEDLSTASSDGDTTSSSANDSASSGGASSSSDTASSGSSSSGGSSRSTSGSHGVWLLFQAERTRKR